MRKKCNISSLASLLSSLRLVILIIMSLAILLIADTFALFFFHHVPEDLLWIRQLLDMFVRINPILVGIIASIICLCIMVYILHVSIKSKITLRRAGIIMLHLGIPVILAGYLTGKSGIDAELQILKGQSSNVIHLKDGNVYQLGFSIKCDEFKVTYYDDGSPADFISYLSFIKDGEVRKKAILRVNHPVRFEGVSLYQSGYDCEEAAIIKIADSSKVTLIKARQWDGLNLGEGVSLRTGHIISDLMNAGPAVQLFIETPDGENEIWLLKNLEKVIKRKPDFLKIHPEFDPKRIRPFIFLLQDINSSCSTGLSVRKDPGVILAAAGGIIFLAGIIMIFIPRSVYRDKNNGC